METRKMSKQWLYILMALIIFGWIGCSSEQSDNTTRQAEPTSNEKLTIMTHDSFSMSKSVLADFEAHLNAKVVILKSGDAGEVLNKAILSKNNPLADIIYGVDNTFLSRALAADMFIPYAPEGLVSVDASLKLDPENRLIPVDFGDVCLNYDIQWFAQNNLSPPVRLENLIEPIYKGLTVVQNPATSSPGLAFLLATISRFGQDGFIDFWKQLKANDVLITNGWKEAYWGEFTAASKGRHPIVVSYASSPAAEVFYADPQPENAPTGVVVENGSAFRQIEFAGILKGTTHLALAKKAMDFLLSPPFQEDIPLQMFVFPASKTAVLPEVFKKHARITRHPATLDSTLIDAKRDKWIQEWTENILQ
jgi:thiamine transport system substrate-binding protein